MSCIVKNTTYCVVTTQHQCDTDEDGYCLDCDYLEHKCCCYLNAKIIQAIKNQEARRRIKEVPNYEVFSYEWYLIGNGRWDNLREV